MTQEDKDLLLKDLCGRLPYGVKAYIKNWSKLDRKYYEGVYTVGSVYPSINNIYGYTENGSVEVILGYSDYLIKPYLFPLSSMTEEQKNQLKEIWDADMNKALDYAISGEEGLSDLSQLSAAEKIINWLNKNHIDYRGLIPKGLAIDCTGLNIY